LCKLVLLCNFELPNYSIGNALITYRQVKNVLTYLYYKALKITVLSMGSDAYPGLLKKYVTNVK